MAEKQRGDIRDTEPSHTSSSRNPGWNSYAPEGHGRTDEQIRADVHEALRSQARSAKDDALAVSVEDGIVTLEGTFEDQAAHDALCQTIRDVPSVKSLRDSSRRRASV